MRYFPTRLKKVTGIVFGCILFESAYAVEFPTTFSETVLVQKNVNTAIDSAITHHFSNLKQSTEKIKPAEIWSDVGGSYEDFKTGYSKDGFVVIGTDFLYKNPILNRLCSVGIFGAFSKSHTDFSKNNYDYQKAQTWTLGFHSDFKIWGLDVSSVTMIGSGKCTTYAKDFVIDSQPLDTLCGDTVVFHSRTEVFYPFKIGLWEMGPVIGTRCDSMKFKGNKSFWQKNHKFRFWDGMCGVKAECSGMESPICPLFFIGVEHSFQQKFPSGDVLVHGHTVPIKNLPLNRTVALVIAEISYRYNDKLFFNVNFSGRYNSKEKSSSVCLGFNKIF